MKFYEPRSLSELFEIIEQIDSKVYFLAGGTDINIQIKKGILKNDPIIYINHLTELQGLRKIENQVLLGSLTSYLKLLESNLIAEQFPFLANSLKYFASPLLHTMATIGGNLANGSPTADITPLLLVMDAKLKLLRKNKMRIIPLSDFYLGYKKFNLKPNEIIGAVLLPLDAEKDYISFYKKVGSRLSLTIAKVSIAGLKKIEAGIITEVKIAAGAVNEYPRRLSLLEKFLIGKQLETITRKQVAEILIKEITPISDLRSDKEYRFEVALNLIMEFLRK